MRAYEFIAEGYKEVAQKFISAGNDPSQVKNSIKYFKELVSRNQITDINEKNIDWWGKSHSFEEFYKFVDALSNTKSKTQEKRHKIVGKSITLLENDEWLVVIPLDKDASCFYGKNSSWCTTKPDATYYENYFYKRGIVLIYCINKNTNSKWAIAFHNDVEGAEYFTQTDTSISERDFNTETGLNAKDLIELARPYIDTEVSTSRNKYNNIYEELNILIPEITKRDKDIEQKLLFLKDPMLSHSYIDNIFSAQRRNPVEGLPDNLVRFAIKYDPYVLTKAVTNNEKVQKEAIKLSGHLIKIIKNPSEKLKLAAVNQDPDVIHEIKNPSVELQLAAVNKDWHTIAHIKDPSDEVIIAAIKKNPNAIAYLENKKNISEEVKLLAVSLDGYTMRHIINPSEKVQMAAVKDNPASIKFIDNPTEKALLYAVSKNGWLISDMNLDDSPLSEKIKTIAIKNAGAAIQYIENPSFKLKALAIQQSPMAIKYIDNPSEAMKLYVVKNNGYNIQYIKNPSEKVQLAAVNSEPFAIERIKNPSEKVQLAAIHKNPHAYNYISQPTKKVTDVAGY